jgi:hypothetical protein
MWIVTRLGMPRALHNLDFNDRRALPASGGSAIANISVFDVADRDQPRAALFASLHGHRRNAARPRSIGNRKQRIRATSMFVDLSGSIMHVRLDGRPDASMQR